MRISDWSSDVCSSDLLSCCLALFACILAATTPAAFAARQTAETTAQAPAPPPPTDDTAPSRQLQAKLTTDEDLSEVTAKVDEGVAELDGSVRSEEHTSELQSLKRISSAAFRLKQNQHKL